MQNTIIIGNAGSGKSSLAKALASQYASASLDLDTLAWSNEKPPTRKLLSDSVLEINAFLEKNKNWVVEGCYADLIAAFIVKADRLIFLNPGIETCVDNCQKRPWEPHKYSSMQAQNKNLAMLLEWVRSYPTRDDEMSLSAHRKLYDEFNGDKYEYKQNISLLELGHL